MVCHTIICSIQKNLNLKSWTLGDLILQGLRAFLGRGANSTECGTVNFHPAVSRIFYPLRVPSMNKGIHASKRDNFSIFFVILNRRTSSTPQLSALKMLKLSPLEVEESVRKKFCVLQGTRAPRTGRTRSEGNDAGRKIFFWLTLRPQAEIISAFSRQTIEAYWTYADWG